ncbi:MAG: TonB family protein [Bacteroidetes bacterium]|nr:MAG: TonB family protein [Bacteroidota bacterium]
MVDSTTTASAAESLPETTPKTRLPKFFFAIEGKKRVGEPINITIVDYDENVNYTIDFGNGVKKRIRKRISYKYPQAGNFLINLIATNSTNASSIYTRSISIAPRAESKPSQPRPAIVDNNVGSNASNTKKDTFTAEEQENTLVATSEPEAENLFAEIIDNAGQEANNLGELSGEETGEEMAGEESAAEMQPKITGPLISAEKMPSFPGGEAAMYKFLSRKLRYPRAARENLTEGKVYLQFVVNEDGSISNINVLRGIGYGCDEEAVRVIRQMPKWIPGEQGGQKVPVYYTMRVTFRLQK